MPAISSTTVQKTLKQETLTLFGRAALNGASGAATNLLITSVATTPPAPPILGVSKGFVSVLRTALGLFTISLDPGVPVLQYLGSTSFSFIESTPTSSPTELYVARVASEVGGVSPVLNIAIYDSAGNLADPASGWTLCFTTTITSSTSY